MEIVWAKQETGPCPSKIVGNSKKSNRFACAEAALVDWGGMDRWDSLGLGVDEFGW